MQPISGPRPKSWLIVLSLMAVPLFAMVCASDARADTPVEVEQEVAEEAEVEVGPSASATTTPLIPRKLLFGNPDKINVQLSPDGRFLSYAAPVDGVLNVWVGPVDDPAAARPVTRDTFGGIGNYFWADAGDHIGYLMDWQGDENAHLYSVELDTGAIWDLTPMVGARAVIVGVVPSSPTSCLWV